MQIFSKMIYFNNLNKAGIQKPKLTKQKPDYDNEK